MVIDVKDYIVEGDRQLLDWKFYQPKKSNLTREHNTEIPKGVDEMLEKGEINGDTADYLKVENPWTSQRYLLLKIHKGKFPPPGRPIILAGSSPTERISQFVDHFLQSHLKHIKSYVRDTRYFFKKLQRIKKDLYGCILFTSHVECMRAIALFLEKYREESPPLMQVSVIHWGNRKLNYFQFNGRD